MKIRESKGFTLIELLIVVAIIGIIAAIAVPGLLRARMSGNEASAIGSLRAINSAESTFSSSCGQGGYAITLAGLGTPPAGQSAFISPDIATAATAGPATKSGYTVTLADGGSAALAGVTACNGTGAVNAGYGANADPVSASTGTRHFATDQRSTIFQDNTAAIAQPIPAAATPIQ